MKIDDLIERLQEIRTKSGNLDVLFQDPNSDGGPFLVGQVNFQKVKYDDEFDPQFLMPKGFKYILIEN